MDSKTKKKILGIELGSTRIKSVIIGEDFIPMASGDFVWQSKFENGIWTYDLEDAWRGIKTSLSKLGGLSADVDIAGISAMMHGYLAFDKDWNLLVPFRTWQNTITGEAAEELTTLFNFNIPQRWSIAHTYQAILNGEEHIKKLAHVTTLSGYITYKLTGVNTVGLGEASGMFPIGDNMDYDEEAVRKFDRLLESKGIDLKLREIFPKVLPAGEIAGIVTKEGAALVDGLIREGTPLCPPEGDAGTGMVATNAVTPGTGNISAGTSVFSMIVLDKPLSSVHEEIDVVATPAGKTVAMVHGNNCTTDMNSWVALFDEAFKMFGIDIERGKLFEKLYLKSLEGDPDAGGLGIVNYLSGESVTHMDAGRPIVTRTPESNFSLANFSKASLYSTIATLKIGMDMLAAEGVKVNSITGHGGLFKTPGVGQRYMAAACGAPVTCMETSGEGGPYGMALLAAYSLMKDNGESLESFLGIRVFSDVKTVTVSPDPCDVEGFDKYMETYKKMLELEKLAIEIL